MNARVDIALRRRRLKTAIHQAQNLCRNFEDTIECRLAWDVVDDLCKADRKIQQKKFHTEETREEENWETISDKEYDV
jgi:hypothetical protein